MHPTIPGEDDSPGKDRGSGPSKKTVLTGAAIGLAGAVIVAGLGTWGDDITRKMVKMQARMLFAPGHVMEAKVLKGAPGSLLDLLGAGAPGPCVQSVSSGSRHAIMHRADVVYSGSDEEDDLGNIRRDGQVGISHPCLGIRIEEIPLHEGADLPPRSMPEWGLEKGPHSHHTRCTRGGFDDKRRTSEEKTGS